MIAWLARNLIVSGAKAFKEIRAKKKSRTAQANSQDYEQQMETYRQIHQLYKSGVSISEIGSRYGCGEPIVRAILKAFQVTSDCSPPNPPHVEIPETRRVDHSCASPAPNRAQNPKVAICDGPMPPPIVVDGRDGNAFQSLIVGRKARISFHRTLRVPEDGKEYPLPAGLGVLPIHRVEDFADRVPSRWLEEGGFFIPLYQKEALFIQFEGDTNRPSIAKVCVGRINAITGKPYSEKLTSHSQDYVVIPKQQWLDGINSAEGTVKQFVAMPLGQGYTIEAQITDEERHGGFQLVIFEPTDGRFPEADYSQESRLKLLNRYAESTMSENLRKASIPLKSVIQSIGDGELLTKAAHLAGLDTNRAFEIYTVFRTAIKEVVEKEAIHLRLGTKEESQLSAIVDSTLAKIGLKAIAAPSATVALDAETATDQNAIKRKFPISLASSPSSLFAGAPQSHYSQTGAEEMGVAAGGKIKQQIFQDTYGVESWDVNRRRLLKIHMVNSTMYKSITGQEPPPSPITIEQYSKSGIPWFSHYDELVSSVKSSGALNKLIGVEAIENRRGITGAPPVPQVQITPEFIRRIKTPDRQEAIHNFRQRARASADAGQWTAAVREINYLIDLGSGVEASDYALRSSCNYYLKQFTEGLIDGAKGLSIDSENSDALSWRARCRASLGDLDGTQEDAEQLTRMPGCDLVVLELKAEVSLLSGRYMDAVYDALYLTKKVPNHQRALVILDEARVKANEQFKERQRK